MWLESDLGMCSEPDPEAIMRTVTPAKRMGDPAAEHVTTPRVLLEIAGDLQILHAGPLAPHSLAELDNAVHRHGRQESVANFTYRGAGMDCVGRGTARPLAPVSVSISAPSSLWGFGRTERARSRPHSQASNLGRGRAGSGSNGVAEGQLQRKPEVERRMPASAPSSSRLPGDGRSFERARGVVGFGFR